MGHFTGKRVYITGAAGGIGQVLARSFAGEGAAIGAIDRAETVHDFVADLAASGVTAAAAVADIADAGAASAAIDTLRLALGPADVLINNAGFSGASNLETTDPVLWQADIGTNLNGAYHCTTAVLADMKSARAGAIVNIGSVNGLMSFGDPAYSAAKAGLISYTKALAMEYGRFGIRANIICPGTVRTPIWDHRVRQHPEIFENLVKWYPLRRVADPADVANAAVFLASDKAAAITGAVLPVDCGLMAGNIVMSKEITLLEF